MSKFGVQRAFIQLSSQFRSLSGQQDVWDVYRREKQLGTGSFGTAYQAVNIKTHEERVIKAVARRQRVAGQWYVGLTHKHKSRLGFSYVTLLHYLFETYSNRPWKHFSWFWYILLWSNLVYDKLWFVYMMCLGSFMPSSWQICGRPRPRSRRAVRHCHWMRLNKRSWSWGCHTVTCHVILGIKVPKLKLKGSPEGTREWSFFGSEIVQIGWSVILNQYHLGLNIPQIYGTARILTHTLQSPELLGLSFGPWDKLRYLQKRWIRRHMVMVVGNILDDLGFFHFENEWFKFHFVQFFGGSTRN